MNLADDTFPVGFCVAFFIKGLHHKQVEMLLLEARLSLITFSGKHFADELNLGLDSRHLLVLHDFRIGVTHDGHHHVHHDDLRDESCQEEQDVARKGRWVLLPIAKVPVTENEQVLADEEVCHPEVKDWLHNVKVSVSVKLEDHQGDTEAEHSQEHELDERANVFQCLDDERDEESCLVEKSAPVKQLQYEQEASRSSYGSDPTDFEEGIVLVENFLVFVESHVQCCDVNVEVGQVL